MIQEDEHIIYISQAKCAVTSILSNKHSKIALNNENRNDVEENRHNNAKMPIF